MAAAQNACKQHPPYRSLQALASTSTTVEGAPPDVRQAIEDVLAKVKLEEPTDTVAAECSAKELSSGKVKPSGELSLVRVFVDY